MSQTTIDTVANAPTAGPATSVAAEHLIAEAFAVDRHGRPACSDAELHHRAWALVAGLPAAERDEILGAWRAGAAGLFDALVAPTLVPVPAGTVGIGTDRNDPCHYWGEDPAHP